MADQTSGVSGTIADNPVKTAALAAPPVGALVALLAYVFGWDGTLSALVTTAAMGAWTWAGSVWAARKVTPTVKLKRWLDAAAAERAVPAQPSPPRMRVRTPKPDG